MIDIDKKKFGILLFAHLYILIHGYIYSYTCAYLSHSLTKSCIVSASGMTLIAQKSIVNKDFGVLTIKHFFFRRETNNDITGKGYKTCARRLSFNTV